MALKGVPDSKSTVRVSRFNAGDLTAAGIVDGIYRPVVPGHERLKGPVYAFLVEHGTRKLLFDLGTRKDVENFAPAVAGLFASGAFVLDGERDIIDVLGEAGIPLESIESVVWSHAHFDHVGDMSKFPGSTSLVVGGETDMSTFPTNPNSTLLESDFAGREVTMIDFGATELKFNDLRAVDYFGDGSLYLVDAPGHVAGHLVGLARVTPSPNPSFILLGGDSFHHAGQARPRPALQSAFPCPAHLLASATTHISTAHFFSPGSHDGHFDLPSRAAPLLSISDAGSVVRFSADPVQGAVTLEKIARWDADEDVLVLVGHDASVVSEDVLPYYPRALNGWKKAGWKQESVWRFLDVDGPAWVFGP
ncbi:Metallo-beta-lactamase superfamily protein [Mycena kentingensis (nom. inval.)]|nr:Metallo-beta-lactamase superfamily protein [Mycena kentingensis (nom. inval.)]